MDKAIQLSDHFTYKRILRFTAPTILMMLFASLYGVVDGLIIAKYAGKAEFAAVNLIWPFPMLLGAVGYMLGTGGCALVSKVMGEGDVGEARRYFTMLTITAVVLGIILQLVGLASLDRVAVMLGAKSGKIYEDSVAYGRLITLALPLFVLQTMFQPYMIAAEKPHWGMLIVGFAGFVNVVLDIWFIKYLGWGVRGAGWASFIGQFVGALLPILLFVFRHPSNLYFGKMVFDFKILARACYNGLSELIVNASMPLVNLLYVYLLLPIAGEDGVGAYGVIMYVNVVFFSVYNGFSMGSAPIVSYHYGAANMKEVKNIRKRMVRLLIVSSVTIVLLAEVMAQPIAIAFAGDDLPFRELVRKAFSFYALSFLFAPFNIYASSFFTALNNGKVSAIISFARIFLFQASAVLLLPHCFGLDIMGFWVALPVAELMSLGLTTYLYLSCKPKYHY